MLRILLSAIAFFVASGASFSAFSKPKVQAPINDPAWFCTDTQTLGTCEFHLDNLSEGQVIRVAYPKAGMEVRFRLFGAQKGKDIKIEFVPQEGYGNSMQLKTGGSTPFLVLKEAGAGINLPVKEFGQNWLDLEAVVLFGRGTAQVVPAIQANLSGKYFVTFLVVKTPAVKQSIEVRLGSEEFHPSP